MSNSILHSFDVHGNHDPMCQQCEIDRLRAEVERLHIITDEQIDAAWQNRNGRVETHRGSYLGNVITIDAVDLGIVECPECVEGWVDVDTGNPQDCAGARCEKCNGHGWIGEE